MRVISYCLTASSIVGLMVAAPGSTASAAAIPPARPTAGADVVAGPARIDVGLAEGADRAAIVRALGDRATFRVVPGLDAIAVDVPADSRDAALATLQARSDVRYAEEGAVLRAQSDPLDAGNRLDRMSIPEARTWTAGSRDVIVAVVDTGVTPNPDLASDRLVDGYDFVDDDADPGDGEDHGTTVANVIAAADNGVGGTGVCSDCRIMPVRVLRSLPGQSAAGHSADVAAGIVWAADHGARIINLSLAGPARSLLIEEAVRHADDKDVLVVAAAGNDPGTHRRYPAANDDVPVLSAGAIGSGATNGPDDEWITLRAYSGFSALNTSGRPATLTGTSGAAAVTSGVAALAMSLDPRASMAEVRFLVGKHAQPHAGYPGLQAARVLHALGAEDTVAPEVAFTVVNGETAVHRRVEVVPAITDDHALSHWQLLVDGVAADEGFGPPPVAPLSWEPAGNNAATVQISVRATDYAGNVTTTRAVPVRIDTTKPVATIVAPASGAHVRGTIEVAVTSSDAGLVSATVNGVPLSRAGTRWSARLVPPASGLLVYDLVDEAGNASRLTRGVVVDNTAPTAKAITPAAGTRLRGTFTSTLTGVTDVTGVATAELRAYGRLVGRDTTAPYSLKVKSYADTTEHTVQLVWKLTDKLGNTRTYYRDVLIDNKAPTVSITKAPADKAKVKGTVKVNVKAADAAGIARVELIVNGRLVVRDTTAAYVLSLNTAKQKKTMKVQVRAYDKLGNVKYTSARTWYRK